MRKHTYLIVYTCTQKKLDPFSWYDTGESDNFYLKDITNNVFVRIPWSNPTQRDLKSFARGYAFGKGMPIEFESVVEEW